MERERTSGGTYTEEYTVEDVLGVFKESTIPLLTAPEVAEELGCSDPTARDRLDGLAEQGHLHRKTVGARAVIYARLDGPKGHQRGNGPKKHSLWDEE